MSFSSKTLNVLFAPTLLVIMTGCGTVYNVKPIQDSESLAGGFEYRLPRNLIEIDVPRTRIQRVSGKLELSAKPCGIKGKKAPDSSVRFGTPTFRLTVNPDEADRFIVDLSAPLIPFTSRSVQMKLGPRATPITFASTSENVAFDVFSEAFQRVAADPPSIFSRGLFNNGKSASGGKDQCAGKAAEARDAIATINRQLEIIDSQVTSDPRGVDVGTYDRVTKELRDRRTRLVASFLGSSMRLRDTITFVLDPCECRKKSCDWSLLPSTGDPEDSDYLESLGANRFQMKANPKNCSSITDRFCISLDRRPSPGSDSLADHQKACENAAGRNLRSDAAGFFYRVPGSANLKVTEKQGRNRKTVSTGNLPVAQYGIVRALPSRFGWLKSSVDQLELDPLTGAVVAISVNGTSFGRDEVQRVFNYDKEQEERRIASLEREKKALELQKAIRELENERGR